MSFFKSFNMKQFIKSRILSNFHFTPSKNFLIFSRRSILSSMMISVSLMNLFKQYHHYNEGQEQKPIVDEKVANPPQKIEWENYSDAVYEDCVKEKNEIIMICNLDIYNDSFKEQIEGFVLKLNEIKPYFSKKKLRFLKVDNKTPEEQTKFEEKHSVKITNKTMFLIKTRYNDNLIKFTFSDFFSRKDYLLMMFAKIRKLSSTKYQEFSKLLKLSTTENVVVLLYNPKGSTNYERIKKKYAELMIHERFLVRQNISFLMIKEDAISNEMKLDCHPGDIFIMQRTSKLNYDKWNFKLDNGFQFQINRSTNVLLHNTTQNIIDKLVSTSVENNVFAVRGLDLDGIDYSFNLEVDLNKLDERDMKLLYETIAEVHLDLQKKYPNFNEMMSFSKIHKNLKKKSLNIFIRDDQNLFKHITQRETTSMEELKQLYSNEQVPDINEPASFTYVLGKGKEITKENIIGFIQDVLDKKLPQTYETQKPPKFQAYSKKVVGKTFRNEIILNDKTQVLFIYSKHCFHCKRLGIFYEKLALEYLKNGRTDVEFNRLNADHNEIDCMRRFNYTPVFLIFKAGAKKNPLMYLNESFNPELLRNYIENSIDYKVITPESLKVYDDLIRN